MHKEGILISSDRGVTYNNCIFIRAGYTDYDMNKTKNIDKKFEEYYNLAKKYNIKIGTYYESRAVSMKDAKEEIDFYLKIIHNKTFDWPISLMIEDNHSTIIYYPVNQEDLSKEEISNIVSFMYNKIRDNNYVPLIITYEDWYYRKFNDLNLNFLLEEENSY